MGTGQIVRFDEQGANLVVGAPIDALARLDNHRAHCALLERLARRRDLAPVELLVLLGKAGLDVGLQSLDLGDAALLVGICDGRVHLVVVRVHALDHLGHGRVELVGKRRDVHCVDELLLLVAKLADDLLGELQRGNHVLLGDLIGAGLDHGDVVLGACDRQVQVGIFVFLEGGVDDVVAGLTVAPDAHAGHRTVKGGAANQQRRRRTHDAGHVGLVHLVAAERSDDNLDVVAETVGKARAYGTVGQARGERALLGGPGLALQIAAGDAPNRVHLLDEIDGQGEEVQVALFLGDGRRDEQDGVALLHHHGAGGLLCQLAGLEGVVLAVQVELVRYFRHILFPLLPPHSPVPCGSSLLSCATLRPAMRCARRPRRATPQAPCLR